MEAYMFKTIFLVLIVIFTSKLFAFESGIYHGENAGISCNANIIQNASSIKIISHNCKNENGYSISSNGEVTWGFGTDSFEYEDVTGAKYVISRLISKDLMDFSSYEEGITTPAWREIFENSGQSKIHYIYTNGQQTWFDVILSKTIK